MNVTYYNNINKIIEIDLFITKNDIKSIINKKRISLELFYVCL